jgi:hypothetical protein
LRRVHRRHRSCPLRSCKKQLPANLIIILVSLV